MLFSFILSLFAATAVFAQKHHASKACTRELEGIVYVPTSCAASYLSKIADVLRVQSPLLWTSQANGVIATFEATYGVNVVVINALGQIGTIGADGSFTAGPYRAMDHSVARSNALGEGFTANLKLPNIDSNTYDYYTSVFWNLNGEMYTVGVAIDSSKAPNFC